MSKCKALEWTIFLCSILCRHTNETKIHFARNHFCFSFVYFVVVFPVMVFCMILRLLLIKKNQLRQTFHIFYFDIFFSFYFNSFFIYFLFLICFIYSHLAWKIKSKLKSSFTWTAACQSINENETTKIFLNKILIRMTNMNDFNWLWRDLLMTFLDPKNKKKKNPKINLHTKICFSNIFLCARVCEHRCRKLKAATCRSATDQIPFTIQQRNRPDHNRCLNLLSAQSAVQLEIMRRQTMHW